jgi:DNA replication protein DnaC
METAIKTLSQSALSRLYTTGETCPVCGEEVAYLEIYAMHRQFKKPCACDRARQAQQEKAAAVKAKRELHEKRAALLYERSGLPKRALGCRFETFIPRAGTQAALAAVRAYAGDFDRLCADGMGLLITGPTGAGKTHLAAALAHALIEAEHEVLFYNATALLHAIQSGCRGQSDADPVAACVRAGLLILDDAGAEKPSAWTQATFYHILNTRIDELRPTVITTNLTVNELAAAFDRRVASRLADRRCFARLTLTAEDYRKTR